ncbi:hypothetical protein A6V37_25015 [Paraburkholderia ginsengiterrae]|uniref:Uncharacterized protein n=1 Tax=Paraburkholderia ginsengiterrae TaxID=1462993 RepID=A0A1A9NA89_9BURK|nr:hypothetical protein A6V37_25015 [Paraburkholderia ginsengiterrae]
MLVNACETQTRTEVDRPQFFCFLSAGNTCVSIRLTRFFSLTITQHELQNDLDGDAPAPNNISCTLHSETLEDLGCQGGKTSAFFPFRMTAV